MDSVVPVIRLWYGMIHGKLYGIGLPKLTKSFQDVSVLACFPTMSLYCMCRRKRKSEKRKKEDVRTDVCTATRSRSRDRKRKRSDFMDSAPASPKMPPSKPSHLPVTNRSRSRTETPLRLPRSYAMPSSAQPSRVPRFVPSTSMSTSMPRPRPSSVPSAAMSTVTVYRPPQQRSTSAPSEPKRCRLCRKDLSATDMFRGKSLFHPECGRIRDNIGRFIAEFRVIEWSRERGTERPSERSSDRATERLSERTSEDDPKSRWNVAETERPSD